MTSSNLIVQPEAIEVHVDETLYLNISLQGLVTGDSIITFKMYADGGIAINTAVTDEQCLKSVKPAGGNKFKLRNSIEIMPRWRRENHKTSLLLIKGLLKEERLKVC